MQLILGKVATELGWSGGPEFTHTHLRQAATRAAKAAKARGITREEAAYAIAHEALRRAQESGRHEQVGFYVTTVDPWAPKAVRGRGRSEFTPPAPPEAFSGKAANVDELFGPLKKREASND